MTKRLVVLFVLSLAVLSLSACGLLQEPEAASGTIEAIPLEVTSEPADAAAGPAATETAPATATADAVQEAEPTEESTASSDELAAAEPTVAPPAAAPRIFRIDPAQSQVRFELDEDLRGERTTVVGITDQVAGEIAVDFNSLAGTQVGVIQINARTLETDNGFRNRAIHNEILDTGAYEFISFSPTAVSGLPEQVAVGEEVTFSIDGELTIRDVTAPVTFAVTASAVSEEQLQGTATATVSRETYGLRIPNVPSVANVEDAVDLTINFVALAG